MEMSRYEDAYAEVLDIINHMEKELFDMIPLGFINMLKSNMNSEYVIKIDYDIGINNQNLLPETRAILSLIYRNFICDVTERDRLEELDVEAMRLEKDAKMEQYRQNGAYLDLEDRIHDLKKANSEYSKDNSVDNNQIDNNTSSKQLVEANNNIKWYSKVWMFIRKIFSR